MQYLINILIAITLVAALVIRFKTTDADPISQLRTINAVTANGMEWWEAPLVKKPNEPDEIWKWCFIFNVNDAEHVNIVWFDADSTLRENHFTLLCDLPNLQAVVIPCKIDDSWLRHLEHCKNLQLVSLSNSNCSDKSIEHLTTIPKISMIFTKNTSISSAALAKFEKSGNERFVNEQFTR